jgi:hypothetical protein
MTLDQPRDARYPRNGTCFRTDLTRSDAALQLHRLRSQFYAEFFPAQTIESTEGPATPRRAEACATNGDNTRIGGIRAALKLILVVPASAASRSKNSGVYEKEAQRSPVPCS